MSAMVSSEFEEGGWNLESKVYLSIRQTARASGLSESFLRREVKAGRIPVLRVGVKALVNYPRLMETLDRRSVGESA